MIKNIRVANPSAKLFDQPTAHVWKYLNKFRDEPEHYATYSYVLTGRNGDSKYLEIVNCIKESTVSVGEMAESKTLRPEEMNIFLIPAINKDNSTYRPNYEISKNLLAILSARSKKRFDRTGPFIVTLYQTISSIQKNQDVDMLFVDLTNINKGSIAELVRIYKNTVLEHRLNGMQKLSSLRLSILNLAFMAEDSLGFAKISYAAIYPIFFKENSK